MKTLVRTYYPATVRVLFDEQNQPVSVSVYQNQALNYGEIVSAKVTCSAVNLKGYFAVAKERMPLFIKTERTLFIGQSISVRITKEAHHQKSATGVLVGTNDRQTAYNPAKAAALTGTNDKQTAHNPEKAADRTESSLIRTALLEEILKPDMRFADGAVLHLERTRACYVFDIDSAQSQSFGEKLNEQACREIARQIILKNLSGVIMIDFIGLKKEAEQKKLLRLLKMCFQADPRTRVCSFTHAKLCELTRKRESASLYDVFLTPDGRKNSLFLSLEIQEKLADSFEGMPTLIVHPRLKNQLPKQFNDLCYLKSDPSYAPDTYELKEEKK